jgi:hypothetical protein
MQHVSHIGALAPCGALLDTSSGVEASESDSFAQWWTQHGGVARAGEVPPGREQLLPTAALCRETEAYVAFAATTQGALLSSTSFSTLVQLEFALESAVGGHGAQEVRCHVLRSCTVPGHMLVQSLTYEEHTQLLSATSEKCGILLFSTRDGDLRLVGEHHPSDRDTADLLNAQSAGFNMRSAAKYHSAATRKLNTVLYGANATFRCTYSGFYRQMQPHGVDNTRFTNSLRPHTLLPVPPGSTRRSESSSALSSSSDGKLAAIQQRQEQHRTSVLYCVQSTHRSGNSAGPAPGSLIMWDFETPSAEENGRYSPDEGASSSAANGHSRVAAGQSVRAISLPPGEIAQIEASPVLSSADGRTAPRGRFGRQPARQIVVCVDAAGSVHVLRPQYKTDFPGPMYPIGYTLITKVIGYLEREDELDAIPGGGDVVKSENGASVNGASASNGSSGSIAAARASAQGSSYATLSDAGNSGRSSVESLVGLQFLEESAPATPAAPPAVMMKSEQSSGLVALGDLIDVASLVVSASRVTPDGETASTPATLCLPFTFADDWLRYPALPASAAAAKSTDLASPVRSLRDAGKFGLLSPQSPWGGAGDLSQGLSSGAMEVVEYDGAATEAGTSSSGAEAFSAGFETYLPAPTRVENGDFEGKLLRQRAALETLKHTILEPHRVGEKMRQLQEEAVHAVYHAEAMRVRKIQRLASQRSQREEERAKQLQQQEQQRVLDAQRATAELQRAGVLALSNANASASSAPIVPRQSPGPSGEFVPL